MRIEGWEKRLAAYLRVALRTPFTWGSHDCALWCAFWVKECTGEDLTTRWLNLYNTQEGAQL